MTKDEFHKHCGFVANDLCSVADKYALKMITPDGFNQKASAIIEKEFNALHSEVERLRYALIQARDYIEFGGELSDSGKKEMCRVKSLVAAALSEAKKEAGDDSEAKP